MVFLDQLYLLFDCIESSQADQNRNFIRPKIVFPATPFSFGLGWSRERSEPLLGFYCHQILYK